jgi:ABC-type xylose transport system substrate-binding protein
LTTFAWGGSRRNIWSIICRIRGMGKIVRIYGAPTDNNAKMFKQGQDEVLKPYLDRGDITVVHEDWAEGLEAGNGQADHERGAGQGRGFDGGADQQ